MFDIHREVADLELCKRLKELGYPQDTGGWYWIKCKGRWKLGLHTENHVWLVKSPYWYGISDVEEVTKAPTVRELGEIILYYHPDLQFLSVEKSGDEYHYYYSGLSAVECFVVDRLEANARAKLLIWLIENGYIKYDDNK